MIFGGIHIMSNMRNNGINLYQLNKLCEEFQLIRDKIVLTKKNINVDKFEKKNILEELQEQENIITGKIIEGILITDIDLKNKVINIIVDFLKKYGYPEDNVISKLSNIKLVTTNVNSDSVM